MKLHDKKFLTNVRDHRKNNYWDVTFDKEIELSDFKNITIKEASECEYSDIKCNNIYIGFDDISKNDMNPDISLNIEYKKFEKCDFSGNNGGKKMTFKNCSFLLCYFSFSEFNDVNFINCEFESCSLSQSKFYRCIFDEDCSFYKISITGKSIIFTQTEISACKLLNNIYKPYLHREELYNEKGLNKVIEDYRMNKSILKLSKTIMESNKTSSDDLFFDSVKNIFLKKINEKKSHNKKRIFDLTESIENKKKEVLNKRDKALFFIIKSKMKIFLLKARRPTFFLDKAVMKTFGTMNCWGGSLPRVFLFGIGILLFYALIYGLMDGGFAYTMKDGITGITEVKPLYYIVNSLLKSFDITFLAGYTKHVTMYDSITKQAVLLSNMLIGLFWYSVLIPTLINKISVTKL